MVHHERQHHLVLPVLIGFGVKEVGEGSDPRPHPASEDVPIVVLQMRWTSDKMHNFQV